MREYYFWYFFLSIIILFGVILNFLFTGSSLVARERNILFPFELIAVENHGLRYKMQNVIPCCSQVFFIITGSLHSYHLFV